MNVTFSLWSKYSVNTDLCIFNEVGLKLYVWFFFTLTFCITCHVRFFKKNILLELRHTLDRE